MPTLDELLQLAENVVQNALETLPESVRAAAEECLIYYEENVDPEDEDAEDILGLFEGNNRLDPAPGSPDEMPRITLFLRNLWDYAGNVEEVFCHEVRLTFLHELGHYLGWDEEEVEAYGLG